VIRDAFVQLPGGEDEVRNASITIKDLRDGVQRSIAQGELIDLLLKETPRGAIP